MISYSWWLIALLQQVICPEVLHEDVIVVKGRLVLEQDDSKIQRPQNCKIVSGSTGQKVCVADSNELISDLKEIVLWQKLKLWLPFYNLQFLQNSSSASEIPLKCFLFFLPL